MLKQSGTQTADELKKLIGDHNVITGKEKLLDYAHDEFPGKEIHQLPVAVARPESTEQVRRILAWAEGKRIPVTARGGGTGMCGGCVPSKDGIVVAFEKLNRIIEIDRDNGMAVVEPGVLLMDFYAAVEKQGLFFPPHPGDETATIGGVIAANAGGARAVKYGVVRNFVKGLEVVLPGGDVVNLGGKLLKNSTGYSLMHLMIGSEGTLGLITKATINLLPPPQSQMTLIAPFDDLTSAIQMVPALFRKGIIPLAVEFIEMDAMTAAEDFSKKKWPCRGGTAHLMIILDGINDDHVMQSAQSIADICAEHGSKDVFVAESKHQQKEILDIRSGLYETMKHQVIEVLDIVIPPAEIPAHVSYIHELSEKYGLWLPTFGHAFDGNVHTHIMKAWYRDGSWQPVPEKEWKEKYPVIRNALHTDARKRGGLVSGEHGIGLVKKDYLRESVGDVSLDLMRRIKKAFDPHNILNPGKII